MNYWLLKSDPQEFSWTDLKNSKNQCTHWGGVRNYQARNLLREMKKNDLAFFYHSSTKPQTIEGIVKITAEAYPDPTQFDRNSDHYDPQSTTGDPRWVMVDIEITRDLTAPITRDELQNHPKLEKIILFKNSRLSVQPLKAAEWRMILAMRRI